MSNIVIPHHIVVLNPHTLLALIPTESKFFIMINLFNTLFSILVGKAGQYILAFTLEGQQYTWTEMAHVLPKVLLLTKFKSWFLWYKSSGGSTIRQYIDSLLLCSPCQISSWQEGRFHLLHLLATKGHKFSKEKLHIVQNQVQYLISEQGLHLDRSQKPSWHLVFPQT